MTIGAEQLQQAFEARAARAELLAPEAPAAAEPLKFAAALFRAQGRCARAVAEAHAKAPLTGRLADDGRACMAAWRGVLDTLVDHGPSMLSEEARARRSGTDDALLFALSSYWNRDQFDFLARALLRPYAEALSAVGVVPDRAQSGPPSSGAPCPFCGGAPIASVRRSAQTSDGSARYLICALCGRENQFPRVRCPSCDEADPGKLPSFASEQRPAVRVEACEACRRYVKSIDMTVDARPIAEVDDLVTLSLDLWANEQGYQRIEPGLAGI